MSGTGDSTQCPALMISAPASGQGKTTVTAALARYHRAQGRRVRVFKAGPDFLDPMILERASGASVYQLDRWMGGETHCRALLYEAASRADLILVEGVMGLFDGEPSTADIAMCFGIPVLAVVDASAMAASFGAIALGLATYRQGLPMAGVLANRVAGARHAQMLADSVPNEVAFAGGLCRDAAIALPERHLGIVQANEIDDLERRLEQGAKAIAAAGITKLPSPVAFHAARAPTPERLLSGVRIAVARDHAFSFLYAANLDLLQGMGADVVFFSPLMDACLPAGTAAVYLPGGYPELHLEQLAANQTMHRAIREHHAVGRPIVAECGGMLYLLESLTDVKGNRAGLVGALPGHAAMTPRLVSLGLQSAEFPDGILRGHTFHHSRMTTGLTPHLIANDHRGGRGEAVYRTGRLCASYVHWYFPSDPQAAARMFLP